MEKEILITIKEFIDNGGQMYRGQAYRQIFYKNGIQFDCQIKELYDSIIEYHSNAYFVKVKCTPNYL